jgi:hypothetical protein
MMLVAIIKATVFALGPTYFSSIDLCQSAPLKAGLIGFDWAAAGFVDTELGVNMEPEVGHGTTEVYARVQA